MFEVGTRVRFICPCHQGKFGFVIAGTHKRCSVLTEGDGVVVPLCDENHIEPYKTPSALEQSISSYIKRELG